MPTFVLFEVGSQRFALPAASVARVLRMAAVAPIPGAPPFVRGVLDLQGTLVPVVEVRARLGEPSRPPRPEEHVIVVSGEGRLVGLEVDRVLELHEAPADAVDGAGWAFDSGWIRGAVKLPGGVVLVQGVDAWLEDAAPVSEGAHRP